MTIDGQARRLGPPPPYLVGLFHPSRPDVPAGFPEVAAAIRRGRYDEAARLLARPAPEAGRSPQVALAVAECWLLAGRPDAAEPWLSREGEGKEGGESSWALACARVHQNRLQAALEPLARLAAAGELDGDRRAAAAALVAHLGLDRLPRGLQDLRGHPFADLERARREGCQAFRERVIRDIARQGTAGAVEELVAQAEDRCATCAAGEAIDVLAPIYEAAVRATSSPSLAERGLRLLTSPPGGAGADDRDSSRALLFATVCGRLDELRRQLQERASSLTDADARFTCWMAAAKVSVVQGDLAGIVDHTRRASANAVSPESGARAKRLRRAAHWMAPAAASQISEWQLRQLHHLLARGVAERLDDPGGAFWRELEAHARASPEADVHVEAANRLFQAAVAIAKDPSAEPSDLRRSLGFWTLSVGLALLERSPSAVSLAVAFTGTARRLLGPDPPPEAIEAHARALRLAPAAEPKLRQLLEPVALPGPPPRLDPAARGLGALDGLPPEVRSLVELCFAERSRLLPETAPFRGRRWFESGTAYERYQEGRQEADARAAQRAFERAWIEEPHNYVTVQGLVFGLVRGLEVQPSRAHVLDYLARYLDQMPNKEIEAALAYTRLAGVVEQERERRRCLVRAAAAMQRRARRTPWVRARNVEIATQLELENLVAAGQAAWEQACQYLPGAELGTRYALLAATLWSHAETHETALEQMIQRAADRAREPRLTDREAVNHAVTSGHLVSLSDLDLDDDALEDLWRACRGDEDDLCRFLEKQATRHLNPRPEYLEFLARKLDGRDRAAAARIRNRYLDPQSAPEPAEMARLRLAAAELLVQDPLTEVATPRDRLCQQHMREFLACLRQCARDDEAAYTAFHAVVEEDALAALFDLREAGRRSEADPLGGRLGRAAEAVEAVNRAAQRFGSPAVATMAHLLASYLRLALDAPAVSAYFREKDKRLIPSRLGTSLGAWWAHLCERTGPLDFFHYHHAYRYSPARDVSPPRWWRLHQVHGKPARQAVEELLESLERHARWLEEIEEQYRSSRRKQGAGVGGFGLLPEFESCCRVLRAALALGSGPDDLQAMEGALMTLSTALRRIDLARLTDVPDALHDSSLPPGRYILPRAAEVMGHWRRNAHGGRCLQAMFEVHDDSGREVLALLCLDEGLLPAPDSVPLRGLAPFADLIDALGGQFHLWMSRPGEGAGCRLEHDGGVRCAADDSVPRIEEKLRDLAHDRWHSRRSLLLPWLAVLDEALLQRAPATLAFAMLPRAYE